MIKKYINNKPDDKTLRQMYKILIENLFITYPKFLEDRGKHDNDENFNSWANMIKTTENYYVIVFEEKSKVIGFLNCCIVNDELWLSEVQIDKLKRNRGILKKLLKEFTLIINSKKYNYIIAHIDDNNTHSSDVFTHIGFESIGNTLYKIDLNKLITWCNS